MGEERAHLRGDRCRDRRCGADVRGRVLMRTRELVGLVFILLFVLRCAPDFGLEARRFCSAEGSCEPDASGVEDAFVPDAAPDAAADDAADAIDAADATD